MLVCDRCKKPDEVRHVKIEMGCGDGAGSMVTGAADLCEQCSKRIAGAIIDIFNQPVTSSEDQA